MAANPGITVPARLPALKACNWEMMYSGCCCASLGLAGVGEFPSAPWQATQTAAKLASPLARSALGAAPGFCSDAMTDTGITEVTAREAATKRRASSFILSVDFFAQNHEILQCTP